MKIALLGYGKMGQLIEEIATRKGHHIVARFSRQLGTLSERLPELECADLAIDFSHAATVEQHVEACLALQKPLVIGTTGWEEKYEQISQKVQQAQGSCLYAPNFSIGAYLFRQMVDYAAKLVQPFTEYDVGGMESHHRHKADQPSGTAKELTHVILQQMPRVNDFTFSSLRCGHMPGTHTLYFDSSMDTLTLTHQARNREGFAQGALLAAEWLLPRRGFFTFDHLMQDLSSGAPT